MFNFYSFPPGRRSARLLGLLLPLLGGSLLTQAQSVSITTLGTPYVENFNTLGINATPSTTTYPKSTLPTGWDFLETGTGADATYSGNLSATGNTYSLGTNASTERALGSVLNAVASSYGVKYTNNTSQPITGLAISYNGEQWRLGSATRTTADRLDFQYSLTATDLTGTFTDVNTLDFISPNVNNGTTAGNIDGNATANRAPVSGTLSVTIPVGGTIILKWVDFDVTGGADDALGIDDVSVTAVALPAVTTAAATASGTSATVGGNVTSAGSNTVTANGVVYSATNATPTIGGTDVTTLPIGSGTGAFSGSATGLLPYTTYNVAAYATSTAGTSYGAVVTVTTGPGSISLAAMGTAYNQDFNTLSSTGTTNPKSTLPAGWDFVETGAGGSATPDNTYTTSTGTAGGANTYSFGAGSAATDRALGGLQSTGVLATTIGAAFTNNTGSTITGLTVTYTGEQWRLGTAGRAIPDRLEFQYSTTATTVDGATVTTGYTDVNALDFSSPFNTTVGAVDGNTQRTTLTANISVSIPNGATFVLRWLDFDASSSDDGLAVDDFSITPTANVTPTVTTAAPSASGTSATVGGNVTSAGTAAVTANGVVYSATNATPTIGGADVTTLPIGSGTGAFSGTTTGLLPYTTYNVAAYATSTAGTSYGTVSTFTTGAGRISIAALNTAYNQDFNTLGNVASPSTTTYPKSALPAGWDFVETGTGADETYSANLSNTGNTYSAGTAGATDRAFGTLQNTAVIPTIGAAYVNNTGQTIGGLQISYVGEQWRLGNGTRTANDRLDFEYSLNATDLVTGTYMAAPELNFTGPVAGTTGSSPASVALDGNAAANRVTVTAIVPVSIAPGQTVFIRWNDFNAPGGGDDILGIDDFSLTALAVPADLTVSTSGQNISGFYNNVTITGTGAATLTGTLTVGGALMVQTGGTLAGNCQAITGSGSFALQNNATLRICNPAGISSTGNTGAIQLTGTRTFSPNANYEYNGTAAQVTGPGLPARVRNLTVNNAQGLTLSDSTAISEVLHLTSGNLSTGGEALVLLSASTGTALIDNTGGQVIGTGTMQRYIDPSLNAGNGYRHYSAPVSNTTFGDLAAPGFAPELSQAAAYNSSATPGLVTPFPNIFGYDEARIATAASNFDDFAKGWFAPASTSAAMQPGHGYTVNTPSGALVDFRGTFNNGPVALTGLTRGASADAGWQLLGNPYPSPIDWNLIPAGNFNNVSAAVYVYRSSGPYTGSYVSYVNGIGGSQQIAAGQGFFVRVNTPGTGSLTLPNASRVTTFGPQPAFYRSTPDTRPQLQLHFGGANVSDDAYVYFEQGASAGFDSQFDAHKVPTFTPTLTLALASGPENLSINGLPVLGTANVTVPLRLLNPEPGTFTIEAAQLVNMPAGIFTYLVDAQTGAYIDLQAQPSYSFTLAANTPATRFSVLFTAQRVLATAPAQLAQQVSIYPNPARQQATLSLPASLGHQPVQVSLLNALGQTVQQQRLATSEALSLTGVAPGIYTVRVATTQGVVNKRLVVE
ncbi:T9SS type A sorting domain-containing protein [Hymenobacter sp. ASUV-10]|uniref:T9SS type A sorting domain-containing protein n=1 Tax=Hymenobacter aranciens TaxID=3063996 RepID=A0ABT9BCU6_9BACT|nr:T9SS type A sorting domain-containing protein [Hymenobacter sp. ASUV-10]MDO7874526.1 T9SS type A sorting domain-containing protein [Hymenobacter sp. ASUV-10]